MTCFRFLLPLIVALVSLFGLEGCAATTAPLRSTVVPGAHASIVPAVDHDAPVVVHVTGPKDQQFVLMQNNRVLSEPAFRGLYRDVVHTNEIDALVHKRASQRTLKVVAFGSGLMVLGVGGVALAALPNSGCNKSPGCAKGVASALLMAGSGAYVLGCVAVKSTACITEGYVSVVDAGLTRSEAERFVERYDALLAKSHPL